VVQEHTKSQLSAHGAPAHVTQLRSLFPGLEIDGDLSLEAAQVFFGDALASSAERYGFTWRGKREAQQQAKLPPTTQFQPLLDASISWDQTQNMFIEGDNLEALKLLRSTHEGRIKMIYIDPPYNTGNEFTYSDRYQKSLRAYAGDSGPTTPSPNPHGTGQNVRSSERSHTAWLNMMFPRLMVAHTLLRDDGVIFISIDDHEIHNLRHLMDEIFGPHNFVGNIIWQSRTSISNDRPFSMNHNHTLVYAKDHRHAVFNGEPLDASEYQNRDNDVRGPWKLVPIDANKPGGNTYYPITNPKTGTDFYPPNGRSWAINPETFRSLCDDGRIKFGLSDKSAPKRKLYLNERLARGDTRTPSSLLLNAGTTKNGTKELMDIFDGKKVFDYPKPTALLTRLLQYGCSKDEPNIVLDFFAGSGSLAHAAILADIPEISFICVQIPEPIDQARKSGKNAHALGIKTISALCLERIRRVCGQSGIKAFRLLPLADDAL
jgi:adenine-specific DNA-methyltransferase